ncbi:hypothetical protein BVE84_06270 [Streptococcus azizii]|uniref:ABC transporter ATP-binding protein n=1 Tax=Streptococcus azizii TaxID=1579424 RepID=A0AB36JLS6_9STRE|nr:MULTISPECIES: hypothetical protein [Streptococcus]MBF0776880.1 hypothetical protein [Streptococcus sp. 19428wD3_AN2]ONK27050.1 hypothetical protein BVE86_05635 [Streptococcus azizii]ONK28403.1 hypothetical protein BVE85_04495 [Streptococcus azizii]ONK28483.1 hypothetical protein BVE84_06270 [Streptococcus azizii]TFU82234.1 hypothetical protein E4T83_09015 [Streptococcus sp. AN2]
MKDILCYTWYQAAFQLSKQINGLFYYLRKIPLLGSLIPETIYSSYRFKKGLFYLFTILSILTRFLAKFIWLTIYVGIANTILTITLTTSPALLPLQQESFLLGFAIWFSITGLMYRLSQGFESVISKANREFLRDFMLSQRRFLQSQLLVEPVLHSLAYIPAWIVLSMLAHQWLILPVGLLIIPTAQLAGYACHFWFCKHHIWVRRWSWQNWVLLLLGLTLAFLAFLQRNTLNTYFLLVLLLIQIPILFISLRSVLAFDKVTEFLTFRMEESLALDKKILQMTQGNEYTRQGLLMQETLRLRKQKDLSHLTGMAYLNALLFQRYQHILIKRLKKRLAFLLLVPILFTTIALFLHEPFKLPEKGLIRLLPMTLMVMYAGSLGKQITQMVFVNCDIAMLHYPFYREPKTILAGFNYRFFQTLKLNSIFALALFFIILAMGHFQYSWQLILLTAYLILSSTFLFSFHDLFIYYILQPFTQDMEVISPLYRILSGSLYWLAYLNTQLRVANPLYIFGLSFAICLYVGIGYLILLKKAPKTFRLK